MNQRKQRQQPRSGWLGVGLLVSVNVAVFLFAIGNEDRQFADWVNQWGWDYDLSRGTVHPAIAIANAIAASFLHLGWAHLLGNIAFLMLLGPELERRIGTAHLLLGYVIIAAGANIAATWAVKDLSEALVGCSGAVAGVMGAYLALFPFRRIGIYLPLGLYLHPIRAPGALLIGLWFGVQLLYGWLGDDLSPLSWRVHIAGFLLGVTWGFALHLRKAD